MVNKYNPKEIRELVEVQGLSLSVVAKRFGAKVPVISRLCKRHNIISKHLAAAQRKIIPVAIIYDRYISGTSLHRLSIEYDTPIATLKRHLVGYDKSIQFRNRDQAIRPDLLNDKNALAAALVTQSCRQLAKQLMVRISTVTAAACKHGLMTHQVLHRLTDRTVYDKLYIVEELSPRAISKTLGLPYSVVLRQLRRYGYPISKVGGRVRASKYWQLDDKIWLEAAYRQKGLAAIATEVGTSIGNIVYHLRKHKIAVRNKEEWLKLLAEQHSNRRNVDGVECDSQMEEKFIGTISDQQKVSLQRGPQLEFAGSSCLIDFVVGDDFVEVKSREQSVLAGVNRRRLTKQWLVCRHNNVDLKVWNGQFYNYQITDIDKYYCINWKLLFDDCEQCADWLLDFGYHGVEFANADLVDGLKKVVNVKPGREFDAHFPNEDALKLIKHFSQHYWASSRKDHLPVSAIWHAGNTVILRQAVKSLWSGSKEVNLYGLIKTVQKAFKDFLSPSIFKPWVAHNLYKRLLPNGGVVVDPCMGWGGRLLGCCDLAITYTGIDINPQVVAAHNGLYKFCKSRLCQKPVFSVGDATVMPMPDGDLLVASPPYDDIENYAGSGRVLLMTIVRNIFATFRGTVALNVQASRRDEVVACASAAGFRLVDEVQMVTATLFRHQKSFEPILIFK